MEEVGEWYGWAGTILRVDLTREKIVKQPLTKDLAYNFLGGRGFNIKVLWDEIKARIDPLSPENVLCLAVGPLTGTIFPETSRLSIACKSPYSGILGDGNAGGHWPAVLKFAGYDQIVITGRASRPVYLWIEDDDVRIMNAKDIWGMTTWEATVFLKEEHGKDISVAGIGQGGENQVRFASTIVESFKSGSRGSGAVWGSKRLKAIAIRGTKGVRIAKTSKALELAERDRDILLKHEWLQGYVGHLGTPGLIRLLVPSHCEFGKKNDTEIITPEETSLVSPGAFLQRYVVQLSACGYNCLVHCKRFYEVKVGPYAGTRGSTTEYEAIKMLGYECGNFDLESILKLNNLCNQYSLCIVPTGAVIAFAMELYERGIITKKDTDGIQLEWGNVEAEEEVVHKIAMRDGFGNKLAEGLHGFAKIIGGDAMKYCNHVKGLSRHLFLYQFSSLMALGFITSTRGADHLRGGYMNPTEMKEWCEKKWGDPNLAKPLTSTDDYGVHIVLTWNQNAKALIDSLTRCYCGIGGYIVGCVLYDPLGDVECKGRAEAVSAVTGWDVTPEELDRIGERIYTLERAFINREGITRKHDWPPPKAFSIPIPGGPYKGKTADPDLYNKLLNDYYRYRGWDAESGIPTREKLEELGLRYVADELERDMPYPEWNGPPLWPLDKYPRGGKRPDFEAIRQILHRVRG